MYSDHYLNNRPFDYQTTFDHLKTRLVRYSDPHCISSLGTLPMSISNVLQPDHYLPFKYQSSLVFGYPLQDRFYGIRFLKEKIWS